MSAEAKLERLVKEKPVYGRFPIAVVEGNPLTVKDVAKEVRVLDLRRRLSINRSLSVQPTEEELWTLATAFYRVGLNMPPPRPGFSFWIKGAEFLTFEDVVDHLERRTEIGRKIAEEYGATISFIKKKARI